MRKYESYARRITGERLGLKRARIRQFPTGLSHYVFDVSTNDGFACVIRIARLERTKEFQRGLEWHQIIADLGVPLPEIIESGKIEDHHFAIYERLQGDDLENVYALLSCQEKCHIAEEVAQIQLRISTLEQGFFNRILPWKDVLMEIVSRSAKEIYSQGLCNPKYIDLARKELDKHADYLLELTPVAFLYDLNVRNVIVFDGKLAGIIDVDEVWFGDPLLSVGRGKTILMAMQQDTHFIDHWCRYLGLSADETRMVELYALLYCLRFMGTVGTKLNGNSSIQTDPKNAHLFEHMADQILKS